MATPLGLSILHVRLRIEQISKCLAFYRNVMGMHLLSEFQHGAHAVRVVAFRREVGGAPWTNNTAALALESTEPAPETGRVKRANHGDGDGVYWKIAVHLPDVDIAIKQLRTHNVRVGDAHQFRDIGYLAHLQDPDSYTIELLQWTFEGTAKKFTPQPSHPLGQLPSVGLITLRATTIDPSLKFYRDTLGMKLICREDVSPYGFVLYFLAFTGEQPPKPDNLDAVENREWLYQRDYPIIEIQVFDDDKVRCFTPLHSDTYGFMGMSFGCCDVTKLCAHLEKSGLKPYSVTDSHEVYAVPSLTVDDPTGIPVCFLQF